MRIKPTNGIVLGLVLLGLVTVAVLRLATAGQDVGTMNTGPVDAAGDSSESFTINGNAIEPISPGVMAPLDLTFMNPHDSALTITDLNVTIQSVSAPNATDAHACAFDDFVVNQASGDLEVTVASEATSTLDGLGLAHETWPSVGMLDRSVNQDGCKGSTLTLAYAASGTLK